MNDNLTFFEKRIAAELQLIDEKMASLEKERAVLRRQLAKARSEKYGLETTTRKNSLNRVFTENTVIHALRTEGKPLTTAYLFKCALVINNELKENTFRTYLHRMKSRGLIKTARHVGSWELADKGQTPATE